MASYSAVNAKHATLAADTVDTVTLTGGDPEAVEILNRGTDPLYFTVNGPAPTVEGDDTIAVAGGQSVVWPGGSSIRLISASATAYSVHRVDE